MSLRDELNVEERNEFKKNNGTVMRMIFLCFKRGWFSISSLYRTLEAYEITKEQILEAIDYFENSGYIETRDGITGNIMPPAEIESGMELRLVPKLAYRLDKGIISDPAIDL